MSSQSFSEFAEPNCSDKNLPSQKATSQQKSLFIRQFVFNAALIHSMVYPCSSYHFHISTRNIHFTSVK